MYRIIRSTRFDECLDRIGNFLLGEKSTVRLHDEEAPPLADLRDEHLSGEYAQLEQNAGDIVSVLELRAAVVGRSVPVELPEIPPDRKPDDVRSFALGCLHYAVYIAQRVVLLAYAEYTPGRN